LSLRRLFAESLPEAGGALTLSKEAARHARVLRLEVGHPVELFDGAGRRATGRVRSLDASGLVCALEAPVLVPPPRPRVHLILGVPKAGALDDAVRGATEAGAFAIHLFASAHGARRESKLDARLDRLGRIVREAARQSERDHVPALEAASGLDALLAAIPPDAARFVASAREGAAMRALAESDERWVAVGPEGGFHPDEERAFEAAGFASITLGPYILRAVTAAPVAVALTLARA
jgi:16S rRNA (uracil1498-N3)-methyltransferase